MQPLPRLAAIVIMAALPSAVRAEEAGNNVWHLYHGDDPAASLVVIDKAELESEEPYWALSLHCSFDESWVLTVSDVDERTLGAAIADGGPVIFSFIVNDEPGPGGLGAIFPDLRFSQMFGEWEYNAPFDLDMLNGLATAKSLAIEGTGAQYALPQEAMAASFGEFRDLCARYEAMRAEPPGDNK